ncbi:MAG TPA: hypothetical protein K8V94_09540 [Corynebacterium amycolatum]|nr:hypothetical protein [Corynebacterium amycolatum]
MVDGRLPNFIIARVERRHRPVAAIAVHLDLERVEAHEAELLLAGLRIGPIRSR